MALIILKPGREKSLLRRHPWVFSGAIKTQEGSLHAGETVDVLSSDRKWLGRGAYSPQSQIRVRIWSFEPDQEISSDFFRRQLNRAIALRKNLEHAYSAYRLINAESDGLPGLIADRYGEFIVCQLLSVGAEAWKKEIVAYLAELLSPTGIYERSDVDVRKKEGLDLRTGTLFGKEPPELIEIQEGHIRFLVDLRSGHKTGFYLDQRDNRRIISEFAKGAQVLNCFAYSGGFGIFASAADAEEVIHIDASSSALEIARKNAELNSLDMTKITFSETDVFQSLRRFRDSGRSFDLIILDPPKFAESQSQLDRACRGYKDINLLAFKLLKPGGILMTFSCSGLMMPELFQKIVADAALDAGCEAQIIRRLSQAEDHPVSLNFPEGHYLKGLVCRKMI
jgi:23S rRNA (cytosine1962-C5)-methyltransferase